MGVIVLYLQYFVRVVYFVSICIRRFAGGTCLWMGLWFFYLGLRACFVAVRGVFVGVSGISVVCLTPIVCFGARGFGDFLVL